MTNPGPDVWVLFFGQVNAESSAASPSAQEEGTHNDVQHNAPQALQPVCANEDALDTRTNHPVVERNTKMTKKIKQTTKKKDTFSVAVFHFPKTCGGVYIFVASVCLNFGWNASSCFSVSLFPQHKQSFLSMSQDGIIRISHWHLLSKNVIKFNHHSFVPLSLLLLSQRCISEFFHCEINNLINNLNKSFICLSILDSSTLDTGDQLIEGALQQFSIARP